MPSAASGRKIFTAIINPQKQENKQMKALLEIHILQNFAPSNLNRDDTGSPKNAHFGGVRRARISSQCLKRAIRSYMRDEQLLPADNLAHRTKRALHAIQHLLVNMGHAQEEALFKAEQAFKGLKIKAKKDKDFKTEYILFLGQQELNQIAELVHTYWDELGESSVPAVLDEGGKKKSKKAEKSAAKAALPAELVKALSKLMDGGKAVDLALFGRMLADAPELNQDAACQVAHAISTHRLDTAFDFYTAVDDLKPDDTQGADMMGSLEFNSSCYYRYLALDVNKLLENLQGDHDLVLDGVNAFVQSVIKAKPSGKQNSMAAQNDPEYIALTLRQNADPRSLSNAFEKPVRTQHDQSLTETSVGKLEEKWQKYEKAYGQAGETFVLNLTEQNSQLGQKVDSLPDLLSQTRKQLAQLLGA